MTEYDAFLPIVAKGHLQGEFAGIAWGSRLDLVQRMVHQRKWRVDEAHHSASHARVTQHGLAMVPMSRMHRQGIYNTTGQIVENPKASKQSWPMVLYMVADQINSGARQEPVHVILGNEPDRQEQDNTQADHYIMELLAALKLIEELKVDIRLVVGNAISGYWYQRLNDFVPIGELVPEPHVIGIHMYWPWGQAPDGSAAKPWPWQWLNQMGQLLDDGGYDIDKRGLWITEMGFMKSWGFDPNEDPFRPTSILGRCMKQTRDHRHVVKRFYYTSLDPYGPFKRFNLFEDNESLSPVGQAFDRYYGGT